jgi:glutaredoxin
MKKFTLLLFFGLVFSRTCIVYITGIGCPHCAKTDPYIFENFENLNLTVIEYEIYKEKENAIVAMKYWERYEVPINERGIPFIFFDEKNYIAGDYPILENLEKYSKNFENNMCLLLDRKEDFKNIDLNSLPGKPKIFYNGRILEKGNAYLSNEIINEALNANITLFIQKYEKIIKRSLKNCVEYSYGEKCFLHSILINDWKLFFNEEVPKEILEKLESEESPKNNNLLIVLFISVVFGIILFLKFKK